MPRIFRRLLLALILASLPACAAPGSASSESGSAPDGREVGGDEYAWSAPVTLAGTVLQFLVGPDAKLLASPDGVVFGDSEIRPVLDQKIWVKNTSTAKNRIVHFDPGTRVGVRHLTGGRAVVELARARAKVAWTFDGSDVLFEERFPVTDDGARTRWHFGRTTVDVAPDGSAEVVESDGSRRSLLPGSTLAVFGTESPR